MPATTTYSEDQWDAFVLRHGGGFLQSWGWSQFQEALGRTVFRFRLDESEGAWVPVDNLKWGDVTVANAGRFVGPDGHIDVKLENTGFQSSVNAQYSPSRKA